ncbi:MAG: hypothetical protein HRT83_05610 [Hyphomicrobiaceae bacterium]|nr:hypothetical protein [Hyphomicrobiaceae bacterium]
MDTTLNIVKPESSAKKWRRLLSQLTDDELAMYGIIARDQRDLEFGSSKLHSLSRLGLLVALAVGTHELLNNGLTDLVLLCSLMTVILCFCLFRRFRTRRFWNKHCTAVIREQVRRAVLLDGKTD